MSDNKSTAEALKGVAFKTMEDDSRDEKNNKVKIKVAVEIETEVENNDWIPDGGWGWGVVAGAVIIHFYIGKTFYYLSLSL